MGRVRGQIGHFGELVGRLIVILNSATLFVELADSATPLGWAAGGQNVPAVGSDTQVSPNVVVQPFAAAKRAEQQLAKLTLPTTESHQFLEPTNNSQQEMDALVYLQRYGYMGAPNSHSEANNLISEDSFSSAVKEFQKFAGISETGELIQR